jgi:hypothetical protein
VAQLPWAAPIQLCRAQQAIERLPHVRLVEGVPTWPQVDFDRVWALAVGGQLKYAHLYFTKPHYNSGLVVSASFSESTADEHARLVLISSSNAKTPISRP